MDRTNTMVEVFGNSYCVPREYVFVHVWKKRRRRRELFIYSWMQCSSSKKKCLPRKITATVKYRPCLGSQAVIIFLASNICCVSSGTVSARYCWDPLAVSGANPGIKKCKRGNGTILTANLRKSAFNWPGKRRHVVTPLIVTCINRNE